MLGCVVPRPDPADRLTSLDCGDRRVVSEELSCGSRADTHRLRRVLPSRPWLVARCLLGRYDLARFTWSSDPALRSSAPPSISGGSRRPLILSVVVSQGSM